MPQVVPAERPLDPGAFKRLLPSHCRTTGHGLPFIGEDVARCSTVAWKKALERAGIERTFRWHDLRHTWASWHVQSGTPLQELMELGGWASFEMVLRYAHLAADHLRGAACRIDGTFASHTKNPQLVRAS